MEPEGQPLTPGTSYEPLSSNSAQTPPPTTSAFDNNATPQYPCSPKDDPMSAKCSWGGPGDESAAQTEGAEPGRSAQRRVRSSAFPSSLSWDSDSEKETLDEEELLHLSNPHGLAAHSPGSPSAGLRLDCEDGQEPEVQPLPTETDLLSQEEGQEDNTEGTKTEEPNTSQLGPNKSADSTVWNVSEGAELFLSKPKDGCQTVEEEADNKEGAKRHMGKESKDIDVYTFPGDSDTESPPPAPWAHCTFIQRCRKKRVLLRPFSGVGSMKAPDTGRHAKGSSGNPKSPVSEGVYDFGEEDSLEEPIRESKDQEEESSSEMDKEIFTCVECSIYFKKQIHLQEHMVEHSQSTSEGSGKEKLVKGSQFRCDECGWSFSNQLALADHQQQHQESRAKILKEIEKLNKNENAKKEDGKVVDSIKLDATFPRKALEAELGTSPSLSPGIISTPNTDCTIVALATRSTNRTPVQGRGLGGYRRRFICTTCNFSTRTPQALANHSKTHNWRTSLASASLACRHCAFQTSSQTILRKHQKHAHPGKLSIGGAQAEENGQLSKLILDSDRSHRGYIASEDSTLPDGTEARPTSQVFKCIGNRRFSKRGRTWTNVAKYHAGLEYDKPSGSEDEVEDHSTDLDSIIFQEQAKSTQQTRSLSNSDYSSAQSNTSRIPTRRSVRHEEKQDVDRDGKVFFLRRSSRVTAATAELGSDDEEDDFDEERARRLLSEAISDEDKEEIDEDMEALKSVERKCPYCPDRFHNGIGLANHVRGHLNRVGVSYNVRHFISPEEVNAIERKFSYQKKKKKGDTCIANFDPDTFSVMHCEFCSAGFDTRAGLSSHARAHLRDLGITNWDVTVSPIHILREVFSSRPDLVIPTAPPRSSNESEEEEEEEENESDEVDEIIEVKLEGDSSERTLSAAVSDALPSASATSWKHEDINKECKDEEEEATDEEDDDTLQLAALSCSLRKTGRHWDGDRSPQEDARTKVDHVKCEVCGAQFETRRGLSSHARSHLRQLGIRGSETSGAPIDFLYQIAKERNLDSQISLSLQEPMPAKNSSLCAPQKDEELEVMDVDNKPIPPSILAKAAKAVPPVSSCSTPSPGASPAPALSGSPSSVVRKAPISSLLPVSSPLRSLEHKSGGIKGLTSNLSTIPTSKPLWAPQENDAPLNLTLEVDPNKDIVCQLCGAWFETRKGLSSHARAHLRHFGVEYSESKGSPIDLLGQLIESDDFKHKASALELETQGLGTTLPSPKLSLLTLPAPSSSPLLYKVTTAGGRSTSKTTSASSLLGPPAKRLKPSSMQVFRLSSGELMALPHSEPPKEIGCEFCGEYFENRKGLSSHARSHLRQMGITQWSVNGSPIDTLREIIARRGLPCALPLKPLKTPPSSSPAPPRSPLSTSSSPSSALLSRLPFAFARRPSPPHLAVSKINSAPTSSLSGLILEAKPEPVQLEVTTPGAVSRSGCYSPQGLNSTWSSSDSVHPLNLAMAHEVEPTRDIRCEFCGEYFENRKGLSSHARSHLRQMGITQWSVNGSPIDTLREVMRKQGLGASASSLEQEVKKESGVEASCPSWASAGGSGTSGGACTYQSSNFRKPPLSLLQSGSRLYKHRLSSVGTSVTPSVGRFFRMSPLGKRPLSEEASLLETAHSPPHHLKTYSPLPHDLSFKTKSPPVKHRPDPSCELCGFYFENRKALASHARAHLRQFGVTEWSVNGSPIETLSAWMRSRPQKVLEMHRSYMQGSRSPLKKKASSSSSSSQWSSSLAVSLVRPIHRELAHCSSKNAEDGSGTGLDTSIIKAGGSSPSPLRLSGNLPLQAQVARSELNVRLPRGFERRPLKHPSFPDGTERNSSSPRPLRTGTIPALVPKPPTYPLVKLEGNFYTLKCRFCEVEFHGPLSVQEDWIRHLQQHILKMNYKKPAAPKPAAAVPNEAPASADNSASAPASTSTSSTWTTAPALTSSPAHSPAPNSHFPPPAKCAPANTATELDTISEEQLAVTPALVPLAEAV